MGKRRNKLENIKRILENYHKDLIQIKAEDLLQKRDSFDYLTERWNLAYKTLSLIEWELEELNE